MSFRGLESQTRVLKLKVFSFGLCMEFCLMLDKNALRYLPIVLDKNATQVSSNRERNFMNPYFIVMLDHRFCAAVQNS